jgi:dipeptidyl aminopeptidase/acylaminoacyl peptidase
LLVGLLAPWLPSAAWAQKTLTYQQPPKAIVDFVDAKPTPLVRAAPRTGAAGRWLLVEAVSALPPIADLAQPELRLAGLRFNPKTNGPSRGRYFTALALQPLEGGAEKAVTGLPASAKIRSVSWAPDARHVAFVNTSDAPQSAGLSLWIVDAEGAQAHVVPRLALNGVFGDPCEWLPDSKGLVCRALPAGRGAPPTRREVPQGPVVQENLGRVTPGRTFQDLLKSPQDETLFDHYATSQVVLVGLDGRLTPVSKPGVLESASASPDGRYILLDARHRPYSYLLPYESFPERITVVDLRTGVVTSIADKPLEDAVPNVHDAVEAEARDVQWRSDAPATLAWAEAADGGDPRKEAAVRDRLFAWDAPFEGKPRKLAELPLRFNGIVWASARLALVEETRWSDRTRILLEIAPGAPGPELKLFQGSFEDRYHDPGRPLVTLNAGGKPVVQTTPDGSGIYLRGEGATADGDQPFLSLMRLSDGETKRLWRSAPPYFETPSEVLEEAGPTILVRRESPDVSPNYFVKNVAADTLKQVTRFPNPYGEAALPKKQLLKYKRADGVDLSAELFLPPGYKAGDGPLPTLIEAYPVEYKTKDAAGQISGSPCSFPFLSWGSPVPFTTQGYAVLQNTTIPIVGEGKEEPNDTYVDQLVASARAAIDEGVRLGVVDRGRVAVMGHSYGAFMTANLLAHTDFFKAGIARSGAYNRTLTPFGFQNEDRTYWQAPEVYYNLSPFSHADRIKTPILLIHGEADNNSGTFPMQSERLFSAIKGQGGTVRFVLLPLESHGYQGRESVLHMFWEMNNWLATYVKGAPSP